MCVHVLVHERDTEIENVHKCVCVCGQIQVCYLVMEGKQERMEPSNDFLFLQKFPSVYMCPSVAHIDSRDSDPK